MRILHIGYNDNSGGASEVMLQLSNGLNKIGINSEIIVLHKTIKSANYVHQIGESKILDEETKQQEIINQTRTSLTNTFFSYTKTYRNEIISFILKNKFDILHLHWIEKYVSIELLRDLHDLKIPIIWTVHDERLYTAGCHCTFGCEEFIDDCKNCVQLTNNKFSTEQEFKRRLAILDTLNIKYIVPSKWIYSQAKKSKMLHNKDIELIHHGIDLNLFNLKTKQTNKLQLLFIAANLDAKHKNLQDFMKILNYIDEKLTNNVTVYIVGNSKKEQNYRFKKIDVKHIPFIKSKTKLIEIYQNSHIFINTSLCESFSLVTVEAMACGCVPMTYLTGGIADIVDEDTAWIFRRGDYIGMAKQLLQVSSAFEQINERAIQCRNKVVNLFSVDSMVKTYKKVYEGQINKSDNIKNAISIVTVTYNAEKDIEYTIKSIINQTNFNLIEFIVIDGGSKDKTLDIINKYKAKIDIFISEPDKGVYDAMNKAIELATGRWINFMNAGDAFYDKYVIEKFIKFVKIDSDLIYGDVNIVGEGINRIVKADLENRIFKETPFCHQSLFVKTELMKREKFNTTYMILADYDFILNAYLSNKKFQSLDFTISKYLLGGMSKQNVQIMHAEGVYILMKLKRKNSNIIVEDSNFYKRYLTFIGDAHSLELQKEVKGLADISFKKNPLKKYKQYKKLMNTYNKGTV